MTTLAKPRQRWAVLGALMAVTAACEAQWLVHAAVARPAEAHYAGQFTPGSWLNVDALAGLYMLVFLVACLPASRFIDRRGLGWGVGVGAALTLVGSVGKALGADSFVLQLVFQTVLALGQPFLTNSATTLAREWFPLEERATAGGLASLAQYLGFVLALGLAPVFVQGNPDLPGYGDGFGTALMVFGLFSVVASILALVFVRRGPLREPEAAQPFFVGVSRLLKNPSFVVTLVLFFLGLGLLNTVTSLTDGLAAHLGVKDSDGLLGLSLLAGGMVAAVVVPLASDHARRRRPFLIGCMTAAALALGALAFLPAGQFGLALGVMALLGAALMSSGPLGFQYAAELDPGVPESTSQGLLLLSGQVSGLALTGSLSAGGAAAFGWGVWAFAGLGLVMWGLSALLAESPAFRR